MLHIVAAIQNKAGKITHLKVFNGYCFGLYDIATFAILLSTPGYKIYEGYTDNIARAIQSGDIKARLTSSGIILEGYSDLPILTDTGKILRPGRVVFTEAGKDPVKAIQSGFKEVQCSPKDLDSKIVCNLAEYNDMLAVSEYTLRWSDCQPRFDIIFPDDFETLCFMAGLDYSKGNINRCRARYDMLYPDDFDNQGTMSGNTLGVYSCAQRELSIAENSVLINSNLIIRLESSPIEQLVLPISVRQAVIELINCSKLKTVICPYGTTSLKITGATGVTVRRNTLLAPDTAKMQFDQVPIEDLHDTDDIKILPRPINDPSLPLA